MPTLALPSGSQPPYPAPNDVLYPENAIANPHVSNMQRQPVFTNLPPGSLFRPLRLPSDMDARLEKASIWMGLDKTTHQAVYFLPPQCKQCTDYRGLTAHCDRAYPSCQRCTLKGIPCEPGTKWSQMRQKGKGRKSGAGDREAGSVALTVDNLARVAAAEEEAENRTRLSAAAKGKGRAVHEERSPAVDHSALLSINPNHYHDDAPDAVMPLEPPYPRIPSPVSPKPEGRGKRTRKKRRLSLAEEIDPELLDDEGNLLPPPKRKKAPPQPAPTYPSANSSNTLADGTWEWDLAAPTEESLQDAEYFARVEKNSRKPPLKNMRAACPAWATTRRALQSGAEYFRDPSRIEGGSVEVGVGGVARGVILEGKSIGGGNYWGTKAAAGTMVISLGSARERRPANGPPINPSPASFTTPSNVAGSSLPRINIMPTTIHIERNGRSPIHSTESNEQPEIEALLLAQRSRVPMAMAVAQDYLEPPFKVPRAFVVLGWFWLTDAWLEPEHLWEPGTSKSRRFHSAEIHLVRWKFRFEWCQGHQGVPWWSPNDDPTRPPTPFLDYKFVIEPLVFSGPGVGGSSTVIHSSRRPATDHRTECASCGMVSEAVYRDAKVCLNEKCRMFFMPAGAGGPVGLDPISKTPSALRPVQRKLPEYLGLKLRGYDPHVRLEDGLDRSKLGSDFWQGWVCGKCGMANERRKWSGWDCDGCKHHIAPPRKPVAADQLHNPLHPGIKTSGAPRSDIGHPNFPSSIKTTSGFTIYEHHIKVVKHLIEQGEAKSEVYHALHARRENVVDVASRVWREVQGEGGEEKKGMGGLLRRGMLSNVSKRPAERHYSSFYSVAFGAPAPVRISGLPPTLESLAWTMAPVACLDAMDLINFRAGCMFPGLAERFNSLVIAVTPPPTMSAAPPTIKLQAGEYLAILILGSEASVALRPISPDSEASSITNKSRPATKAGSLIVQHGDVLGIMAEEGGMEISVRMDGFGMVCFGQQVYNAVIEAGLGAFTTTTDRIFGISEPIIAPKAVLGAVDINTIPIRPKSKVFVPAPLTDWYIGPRPLDKSQPMRLMRPIRALPSASAKRSGDAMEVDEEMAGNEEPVDDDDGRIPFVEIEIDPEQATGYIIIDDPSGADGDNAPPGSPKLLVCNVPPSPTVAPSVPAPKKRTAVSGRAKAAAKASAASSSTPAATAGADDPMPDGPRKKRKYVFKNKPIVGELDEDGGEGGADSANATPVVKPKKPRAKPGMGKGRSKRVSDIGGSGLGLGGMDEGLGEASSPIGTIATVETGSSGSPSKRKRGRPRKLVDAEAEVKEKRAVGRPRKSAAVSMVDDAEAEVEREAEMEVERGMEMDVGREVMLPRPAKGRRKRESEASVVDPLVEGEGMVLPDDVMEMREEDELAGVIVARIYRDEVGEGSS